MVSVVVAVVALMMTVPILIALAMHEVGFAEIWTVAVSAVIYTLILRFKFIETKNEDKQKAYQQTEA